MNDFPTLLQGDRTRKLLGLILCGLTGGAAALAAALLVRFTFDALYTRDGAALDLFTAGCLVAGFAGVAAVLGGVRIVERTLAEGLGQSYVAKLRLHLFEHLLEVPVRHLQRRRRGHLMLRFVGDLNAVRLWVSQGLARIVSASITTAFGLGALAWFNLNMAITAAALIVPAGVGMLLMARPLSETIRAARRRRSQLAGNLGEKVSDIAVVQAFGREQRERRRIRRQNRRLLRAMVRRARLSATVRALPEIAGTLATGLIVLVGLFELQRGTATPGTIVAGIIILGLLTAPLGDLARVFDYWRNFRVAREKIANLLAIPTFHRGTRDLAPLAIDAGRVTFNGVTVDGSLHGFGAEAAPGKVTAIVGPNGAGKSTLLLLAAGLVQPDDGEVRIDGQALTDCTPASVRRAVSLVSPDLPLLRGSIGWNLRYRWPDAPDAAVADALHECGLADAVDALPNGLRARVQEGGRNLSSGLRQRLRLARALLGHPAVLVLDEVDSELDGAGRELIDGLLATRDGTTLIATHDPRRLRAVDEIWHVAGGRLVERGAPADLLERDGPTARLFGLRTGQLVEFRRSA